MRVIQVVGAFVPERCGIAHYAARLTRELRKSGLEVAIGTRPPESVRDPTAPSGSGTTDESIGPILTVRSSRWSLAALVELVRLARWWRADWLHLQYAPSSYDWQRRVAWLPLVARLAPGRLRVATTIHEYGGWPFPAPSPIEPLVDRALRVAEGRGWLDREALALLSCSHQVLATNPRHLAAVAERSPSLAKRLRVVPIGPNVGPEAAPGDRAAARRALGVDSDRLVLAFFGFVHPVKGIETLLQATARVRETRPDVRLWVVGGVHSLALRGEEADGYEAKVRALIAELGLTDAVELTGFQPDEAVGRRLRAADLAVLPFNHGAMMKSGTLVTCLSYGLPVITTSGADLNPLRHGLDVWVVPPTTPEALAAAILTLAADEHLRRGLGAAALDVAASYSWPRIAAEHLSLYGAAPAARPPAVASGRSMGG